MKKRVFVRAICVLFPTFLIDGLVILGLWYVAHPAISLRNEGFWWMLALTMVLLSVGATISHSLMFLYVEGELHIHVALWILTGVVFVVTVFMELSSWMWFHTQNAIRVANVSSSEKSVVEVLPELTETGMENLTLVDLDTAIMLGDKKVAGLENASWYDVEDNYSLVRYQGKYYRLSFLKYGDFWKYRKAKYDGIPGYILVETTPEGEIVSQEAVLVELKNPIRYSTSGFFSYDLKRHLRFQYSGYIFGYSISEIDENGVPYFVTAVLEPTGGMFGQKVVKSVILTNACTGDSTEYRVDEVPEWVENVYSVGYLMKIAEWRYTLRNGYWNFSKTGVWHTSFYYRDKRSSQDDGEFANFYGYSMIVVDGKTMIYTGLTAANRANSNLGWLLMDTRTGEMTEYSVVGAEESSAQGAVEQLVSAYRYQATFPLPVNVGGEATYLMCLKGSAGIVQAYGLCNVTNYSIVVQAETLPEAIGQYLAKLGWSQEEVSRFLARYGRSDIPTSEVLENELPFDIDDVVSVSSVEINGGLQYYYELTDGRLFVVVEIR